MSDLIAQATATAFADAIKTISDRGQEYGDILTSLQRAGQLASIMLDMPVSPYVVATILECVKEARLVEQPTHRDSYVDGINYKAFRAALMQMQANSAVVAPGKLSGE